MEVASLTFEQLIGAAVVILILVGIYNTVMSAIKTHREEKQRRDAPVNDLEETVKDHTEKLQRDHDKLQELEESNRIMMRALMAMLSHEINGNSVEGLKVSLAEIQKFLIEK